jgi:hypothetical protein
MSTRSLPTPPPEDPAVPPAETDHTAPPTTDAEEAATPADQPPVQQQPTQIHTIYREVFPIFANKVLDRDWVGLATLAELHDLRVMSQISCLQSLSPKLIIRDLQTEHDADVSRLLLTAPLVLSYLILDDMYDLKATNAMHSLILCDQTSREVCIDPPTLTTPTPPPNGRTL